MLSERRRDRLLSLVREHRSIGVDDLATLLGVSVSTIRRDLDEMHERGLLRRVHGGALSLQGSDAHEEPVGDRAVDNRDAKDRIAARAVELVEPGSTILLTGGSTTAQMAPYLGSVPDITVVTNSIAIAYALGTASDSVQVLVLGGQMRAGELSLLGYLTTQALAEIHIDTAFLSAYGVDHEYGILGAHLAEAETDRNMVAAARRLVVLADHSKFSRRSAVRIAPKARIDVLVTDRDTPREPLDALREHAVLIHRV
ncbi:DeoR/GlpR family DNA-binding transcription regulator [Streptomyces sp. NPDC007325]|uniref:DeoR/GlpR family DNA-binding transcription regulator n=1 Tax=Streptomyces sp. NPDC007325 TaxID=3154588 RepID=UPI0033C42E12